MKTPKISQAPLGPREKLQGRAGFCQEIFFLKSESDFNWARAVGGGLTTRKSQIKKQKKALRAPAPGGVYCGENQIEIFLVFS
jgi:hypothetical protein